jgi:NAD(P)-dependent dehydrogenase (short-subunit alcohol dehydrogenase family)
MDVAKKVAVVTGGASGIGRGIARALAADGAHVVVADVEAARAESVAEELRGRGARALGVACDVTLRASVEALAERAWREFGRVDLLVNNAGVGAAAPLVETPIADAEWIFAVNVFGVLHGCQVFVPRMRAQGGPAHILNTGSEHSLGLPFSGLGIYTASKHAVLALSDVLRHELAADGIGVSILCPAKVKTEVWNAGRNRPERFGGKLEAPPFLADLFADGLDADYVGRLAVDGVKRGDFFVLTHPEVRAIADARAREVSAAFDAMGH